jgi:NADH dehydrogenase [ubiquinone] 1 alpha subcomplex assembly factor 7
VTALADELRRMIAAEGPISVERYMALCLGHPLHGYYMRRDPLGAAGDFTTAPEISQMFGELIGLWAIEVWAAMGGPERLRLVELGPGRGTLMADLLRAARLRPAFLETVEVDLVETSPALREKQRAKLARLPVRITWRERFADVPDGAAIVIANEFFDVLPVRQFVRTEGDWRERLVGLDSKGGLAFGLAPELAEGIPPSGRPGDVLEWPGAALEMMSDIAGRLASQGGGAALVLDYGYEGPAIGDTLQAVESHAYADPLAEPGAADLTVHVDFAKLAVAARAKGARVHGPVGQGAFLRGLGIGERAARLKSRATPAQAADIDQALRRLTSPGPDGMGELFKALCVSDPGLAHVPGFALAQHSAEALA